MGYLIASTARALELHPVLLRSWLRSLDERGADPFVPVVVRDATHTPSSTPAMKLTGVDPERYLLLCIRRALMK